MHIEMKVGDLINTYKFNIHYDEICAIKFIATIGQQGNTKYFCNIPPASIFKLENNIQMLYWLKKYPTLLRVTHIVHQSGDFLDIPFLEFVDKDYLQKVQEFEKSGIYL